MTARFCLNNMERRAAPNPPGENLRAKGEGGRFAVWPCEGLDIKRQVSQPSGEEMSLTSMAVRAPDQMCSTSEQVRKGKRPWA